MLLNAFNRCEGIFLSLNILIFFFCTKVEFFISLETQYANQPGTFYTVPPQELVYYPPMSREPPPRSVYDPPRPQAYHIEPKHVDHYSLRPPATHVTIHGNSIPLTPAQPPSKTGSITSGYPVRSQTYQAPPQPTPTSALYTASQRPLYQTSGTMTYPPRD